MNVKTENFHFCFFGTLQWKPSNVHIKLWKKIRDGWMFDTKVWRVKEIQQRVEIDNFLWKKLVKITNENYSISKMVENEGKVKKTITALEWRFSSICAQNRKKWRIYEDWIQNFWSCWIYGYKNWEENSHYFWKYFNSWIFYKEIRRN